MTTEVRVYDMEDGHPCVVMVTSGTHDVSRLANLLTSGRCEDQATADYIRKTLNRHRGGRSALKLLKDHGGPDLLVDTAPKAPTVEPVRDWRTATVVGLEACQFGATGREAPEAPYDDIHLVRKTATGTPGPTLCGIDRFTKDGPGWDMGIGYVRTGVTPTGCSACAIEAAEKFHDVPIQGLHKYVDIFAVVAANRG